MKKYLFYTLVSALLLLVSNTTFAQAPTLGTAANFVLFTTNGAMTNSGIPHLTHLTGNVGSNLAGAISGFGNVDGQMHDFDVASGACVGDVISLYNQLNTTTSTFFPVSPLLGNGDTLVAGVYQYPLLTAASLNLELVLNGQGNPNALFIIKINGAFSVNPSARVKLINGALACNVFWKVEGLVSMASGATMRGNIVAHNAAINMSTLDTLEGRALSINGAVTTNSVLAYMPTGCGSVILTGPAAPALVSTAAYGVFSSIGSVTSTPITYVIGDVGSNSTLTTGFNPLNVTGTIHGSPDASTAACAGDLTNVYNYLNALPPDILLLDPANFGFNLVLTPHTYLLGGATLLNDSVFLNAENDPDAVFVIQVNGAFTTTTSSSIKLINGAKAKNVYWLINGAVHIFDNSFFNGQIIGAGAITLNPGDTLEGRALTINGAVAINGSYINDTPPPCNASLITGTPQVCQGSATTLADADTSGTWSSSNNTIATVGSSSGIVTGVNPGIDTVTYLSPLACVAKITVTVNPAANAGSVSGPSSVCAGSSIILTDATTGGIWSSSNATASVLGGTVTGITAGIDTIRYTVTTSGCTATATKTVTVNPSPVAGTITGASTVCAGSSITLIDIAPGGVWSSSNATATVIGGTVTGVTAGIDTISYTVANTCGTASATKIVTVNPSAGTGVITGASSVCASSSIVLTDGTPGGVWSSSNATATVLGGTVTGITAGVDTIAYTVTSTCGTVSATKVVTVNPLPFAGVITGPSSVCAGSSITLTDIAPGGVWSSSNATATVLGGTVTGVTAGTDTIRYTVTNSGCTAAAAKTVTVNALPSAGVITGASSVCVISSVTLTDLVTGGVWSSSNATASVLGGTVTGITPGTDTIRYTITSAGCSSSATKTVTVNPLPNAGSISGPSSVCVSSSMTLVDLAPGGVWSSSNATAGVLGGTVTGVTAGIDTIVYTVSNLCSTATATKIITVNPLANPGSISGPSSVCAGSSVTFADGMPGGVWSSSNGTATVAGGTVTGVTAGIDTIIYTVTNICGATATSKSVIVNPLPNAGSITGPSSVCVSSSITLADAAPGGVWSSSNTALATVGTSGIVTGIAAGSLSISYSVTNGCSTANATATFTVNPLPNAGVITGASSVCTGSSISLSETATGGIWSISNATATFLSGVVTGVTAGMDTIRYTVTNVCGTTAATKVITINSLPAVPVISIQSPSSVCTGTMYQNFGAASLPLASITYKWTATNATVWAEGTSHQNALISFVNAGVADVTLNATITSTGCTSHNTIAVNVGPSVAQVPVVTYFNKHFVCTPNDLGSYQWGYDDALTLDSTILTGEINQDYLNIAPDFTHKLYWAMTTMGDCMQKTYYVAPLTVQDLNDVVDISVYPNPANHVLNVIINSPVQGSIQVELSNMLGQKVNMVQAADNKALIDVSSLPAGTYIINCYSDGNRIAGAEFIKN